MFIGASPVLKWLPGCLRAPARMEYLQRKMRVSKVKSFDCLIFVGFTQIIYFILFIINNNHYFKLCVYSLYFYSIFGINFIWSLSYL